jgi:hypothetical protein
MRGSLRGDKHLCNSLRYVDRTVAFRQSNVAHPTRTQCRTRDRANLMRYRGTPQIFVASLRIGKHRRAGFLGHLS